MSKTIKIFIITFLIALSALLVFYWLTRNEKTNTGTGETPWYQEFNPFGTGGVINNIINDNQGTTINNEAGNDQTNETTSRFYKLTDFAVAGATFLEDTRPVVKDNATNTTPEEIKTIISPETIEGRKEIQTMLNTTLSLNPPLKTDGNFGKLTSEAIKSFQKINGITETGKVDEVTAPFFVKITTINNLPQINQYESAPSIRYVERTNGHMYKMFLDTKTPEKISNSTIPSIYEALFNGEGKTVIYRYLSEDKTISTFLASLGASKGEFLQQNIADLSISLDKTKFFYLIKSGDGVVGMVRVFGGSGGVSVFSSPFTEWISQWAGNDKIFLTTKASYDVSGSIFSLDTTNKTLTKIFEGVSGFTTLVNNNATSILYSEAVLTGPRLKIFDSLKHSAKDLDVYGLPEKCVWDSDNISIYCAVPNTIFGNQYPDVWYQGLVSFDDYFVKINTKTGDKITIANSKDETPIDGTHLFLDDKETTLFFINKKDGTLWGLDIK